MASGGGASRPPTGLRDAIVLFALVVVGASLCNLSQTGLNAMISPVMAELGIDVDAGQWLTSAYILVLGVAVPVAAYLQRRTSDRAFALLALSMFGAGSVICFFAFSFSVMLIGRIVQAVSGGLLIPQLQTIAMTRFPENRRATATGVGGIGLGLAPDVGPAIGGAMEAAFGRPRPSLSGRLRVLCPTGRDSPDVHGRALEMTSTRVS